MSANSTTSEFLFLFRDSQWEKGLPAEQVQQSLGNFMAWFERLSQEGVVKAGQPLERTGRVVSGKSGRTVADGPFAEAKEAVGGYFIVNAADIDEAVEIARHCPVLEHGVKVEVRPISDACPTSKYLSEQLATANA